MNDFQFDTIEQALGDLRAGKVILVTDDPDRENEGDLICAAQFATTENVNFMASVGKGLICMPMSAELCRRLRFPQMVTDNTDGIHRVGGSCGHDNGHLGGRARPYGAQSGGSHLVAQRLSPAGPHVSPYGEAPRRAGAQWAH